jgi:hypothetical protein
MHIKQLVYCFSTYYLSWLLAGLEWNWWANKCLKHVEAINHNKLKENGGFCWSCYNDKCGYPEKKTDTRNHNIVASVILNCAIQKTKCTKQSFKQNEYRWFTSSGMWYYVTVSGSQHIKETHSLHLQGSVVQEVLGSWAAWPLMMQSPFLKMSKPVTQWHSNMCQKTQILESLMKHL